MNKKITKSIITIYISIYSLFSYFTLTLFPYIHSDEPWLAGLSKAYLEHKTIFVTEPFFDLMPRTAHSIKSFFHFFQSVFISLFGYNIHSVRLISFLFGIGSLILIYLILEDCLENSLLPLLITILISLNKQFIYASHLARQEIILVFMLCLAYRLYQLDTYKRPYIKFLVPCVIGISIGFHANAFILALMIGIILLKDVLSKKKKSRELLYYISILSLFALTHIIISLIGNPNFISEYINYGSTLGITATPTGRIQNFIDFYIKLYYQVSGTYYLPDLKEFFGMSCLIVITSFILLYKKKDKHSNGLLMLIAFNIGIFIIGRFNPTSIVFFLFPIYLLLGVLIDTLLSSLTINSRSHLISYGLYALVLVFIGFNISSNYSLFTNYQYNDYDHYEATINDYIDNSSIVLGNLSSGFVFGESTFLDIRNLAFLSEDSMTNNTSTLYTYLKKHKINTIIYYEEYDYIHRNSQWQILYGDDTHYYHDLNEILTHYGQLLYEFEAPIYGTRIIRYMNDYPFKVMIYQIDLP